MQTTLDDRFVVLIRENNSSNNVPALKERELVTCSTYEEAAWIKHELKSSLRYCIIRYIGPAGGGD